MLSSPRVGTPVTVVDVVSRDHLHGELLLFSIEEARTEFASSRAGTLAEDVGEERRMARAPGLGRNEMLVFVIARFGN